jgi:hypothetical protein
MSPLRYPAKAKAPRSLIAVSIRLVNQAVRPGQASHESYSSKAISKARRSLALLPSQGVRCLVLVGLVQQQGHRGSDSWCFCFVLMSSLPVNYAGLGFLPGREATSEVC